VVKPQPEEVILKTEPDFAEAARAVMLNNLETARTVMQSYMEFLEGAMKAFPNANEQQISAFRAGIERQLATNHAFAGQLLRAKNFGEVMQLQLEYFKSLTTSAAQEASRVSAELSRSKPFSTT
jgi:hypothetical protein